MVTRCIIDGNRNVPFEIKRAFWIYKTLGEVVRGAHSNLKFRFAFVCIAGSCKVRIRKSANERGDEIFILDQPDKVLVMTELVWKEMYDFSKDAVLLCLSSELHDTNEYIRDLMIL